MRYRIQFEETMRMGSLCSVLQMGLLFELDHQRRKSHLKVAPRSELVCTNREIF